VIDQRRHEALSAFGDQSWAEAARKAEQVIRIAGPAADAGDHELFAESLLRLRRFDDAHTALLVATSSHPASAGIRSLALETFRRQRGAGVEHDLGQLARQYIRRFTVARGAQPSVGLDVYSVLFLARAGLFLDAGRSLSALIGNDAFLDQTESDDIRVLLDLALRQQQYASAELLIEDGRRRFAGESKLAVLHARYLNATRQHAEATSILEGLFSELPELSTRRNRLHLVRALSSDDRLAEASRVLESLGDLDPTAATERIKLICKAIDIRFALTHIDPVSLPEAEAGPEDEIGTVLEAANSWTSAEPSAEALRSAGLERTLTTTLMIGSRVGIGEQVLPAADVAGPVLDVVFGDDSWRGSPLGSALEDALLSRRVDLDDNAEFFESAFADSLVWEHHPRLNAAALERLALWHGGLRVAHHVNRLDWEQRFTRGLESEIGSDLHDAVAAACQLGRRDAIPEMLAALERDQEHSMGRVDALRGYVNLLAGDRGALVDSFDGTSTANERRLREFLEGKSVALVGPAPGDQPNGAEIDSFDVVLRPNRLVAPSPDQVNRHGSRIDIVSFAATRVRQLRHVSDPAAQHLDPSVRFAFSKYRAPSLSGGAPAVHVSRHSLRHVNSYALRQLNHLPQIIFYLNSFDISRLKVFNANFFLSREPWEQDYVPDGRISDVLTQLVFSDSLDVGHWFVRSLYRSGVMEADEQLATVLDLDTERYMQEMSEMVAR
jgi:hypothetical protein